MRIIKLEHDCLLFQGYIAPIHLLTTVWGLGVAVTNISPEHNDNWTLAASDNHQPLPDHEGRRDNHPEIEGLIEFLRRERDGVLMIQVDMNTE